MAAGSGKRANSGPVDAIHLLVGALGREDGGREELKRGAKIELGDHLGVGFFEDLEDLFDPGCLGHGVPYWECLKWLIVPKVS